MWFISPTTGWVASEHNAVHKATDGGATWTSAQVGPGGSWLFAKIPLKFADSQVGWTANPNGVFKSADGGATWTAVLSDFFPHTIEVAGPDRAWLTEYDSNGSIMITTDGGATWTEHQTGVPDALKAVDFIDAQNGWAVGQKVHRTTDGGATWTVVPTPVEGFTNVAFVSPTIGWVVGTGGVILKTTSGGVE